MIKHLEVEPIMKDKLQIKTASLTQHRAAWHTQGTQQHRAHALNVAYRALLEQAIHISLFHLLFFISLLINSVFYTII